MKTPLLPLALYWASFNRFELRLPGEAVNDIAQSGSNDEAVTHWAGKVLNEWPDRATPDAIRAELKEAGADWDEEDLADDAANWERIIWIAAHNIAENTREAPADCSPSVDESKRLRAGEAGGFELVNMWGGAARKVWQLRLRGEYLATFTTRREAREALLQTRLYVLRDAGSLTPIHEVARRYLASPGPSPATKIQLLAPMTSPTDFISRFDPCRDGRAFLAACQDLRTAWQTCERPDWMLWALRQINHTPEKELRLFACACARRVLPRFEKRYPEDTRPRTAIETAERYANGQATAQEMRLARAAVHAAVDAAVHAAAVHAAVDAADAVADASYPASYPAAIYAAARTGERKACADLLRQFVPLPDNVFA